MIFKDKKQSAAFLSIVSNTFLIITKGIVGFLTGSISIISEAVHSTSDLLASFIAFFSVRISAQPADDSHPYGHGKFEDLSGLFEGLLILGAAIYIIYESTIRLNHCSDYHFETGWGIAVMLISVVVNIFVSSHLFKVGKETDSIAIIADAQHLKTDILTSAGVLIGLVFIKFTGLSVIDPIIAIIVALIITKTAVELCFEASKNLLDGSLPEEKIILIEKLVENYRPHDVIEIKHLKTRKAGNQKIIELTLTVHENFTIKEGHDLCDKIENDIKNNIQYAKITIHLEPCDSSCNLCPEKINYT